MKKRGRPKKKSTLNCHKKKSTDVPNRPAAAGVAAATRLRLEVEDYVQSAATVGGLEGGTEQAGAAQVERGESDDKAKRSKTCTFAGCYGGCYEKNKRGVEFRGVPELRVLPDGGYACAWVCCRREVFSGRFDRHLGEYVQVVALFDTCDLNPNRNKAGTQVVRLPQGECTQEVRHPKVSVPCRMCDACLYVYKCGHPDCKDAGLRYKCESVLWHHVVEQHEEDLARFKYCLNAFNKQ